MRMEMKLTNKKILSRELVRQYKTEIWQYFIQKLNTTLSI